MMDTFGVRMLTRVKIAIKLLSLRTSIVRELSNTQYTYLIHAFKFPMTATDINPSKLKKILFYAFTINSHTFIHTHFLTSFYR